MRTFIAIDFPDEVIKEIARLQSLISKKKFTGKLTELGNLHLTLKFLGEITEETLKKVKTALKKVKFSELSLSLGEIGFFKHGKNPRIVWIKINGESVWQLQKQIDSVLSTLFKPEERFMSHLTIARINYVKDKGDFIKHVKNISARSIKFNISSFKLKLSELNPSGSIYTTLQEYPAR